MLGMRMARPAVAIALQNPIKPDRDDRIRGSGRQPQRAPVLSSTAIRRHRRRSDCPRTPALVFMLEADERSVTPKRSRTISSTRFNWYCAPAA
jgi:hypothetical protein